MFMFVIIVIWKEDFDNGHGRLFVRRRIIIITDGCNSVIFFASFRVAIGMMLERLSAAAVMRLLGEKHGSFGRTFHCRTAVSPRCLLLALLLLGGHEQQPFHSAAS